MCFIHDYMVLRSEKQPQIGEQPGNYHIYCQVKARIYGNLYLKFFGYI